jgi:hypothetical protein
MFHQVGAFIWSSRGEYILQIVSFHVSSVKHRYVMLVRENSLSLDASKC